MTPSPLRLVRPVSVTEAIEEAGEVVHSLCTTFSSNSILTPSLAKYLIGRFSKEESKVLDLWTDFGVVPVVAHVEKRVALSNSIHKLFSLITDALINPVDLANVALKTQTIPLKKPVSVERYTKHFRPFFDLNTFRELENLRVELAKDNDKTARFAQILAMAILHGPSAGYLSSPCSSLGVSDFESQERENIKRRAGPEYRAVSPRILKRAAASLSDGLPLIPRRTQSFQKVTYSDPRNLISFESGSVDLVVTELREQLSFTPNSQWLRCWFSGVPLNESALKGCAEDSVNFWGDILHEAARVTALGGRFIGILRSDQLQFEEAIKQIIERDRFWYLENRIQFFGKKVKVGSTRSSVDAVALILRRD